MLHISTVLAIAVLLVWRWLSIRRQVRVPDRPFRTAVKKELVAWTLTFLALAVGFAVLFGAAEIFGPIPQVHEW